MNVIDYKQIIIDGYKERQSNGTPYKSYFRQYARIHERDYFIEHSDFFAGCGRAVNTMKQSIEYLCNENIKELNSSILYWKNFIPDIIEWENHLRARGIIVNDYDRKKHQEENEVDRAARIKELEELKMNWEYEKHGYVYERAKSISGRDKTIPYSELSGIERAIVEAMQELGVEVQHAAMPGIAKKLSKWITGTNDWVLSEIIINKRLPERADKPEWIGSLADAYRFKDKVKMSAPGDFNSCFYCKDGKELHDKNKPENMGGEISTIMKEIMDYVDTKKEKEGGKGEAENVTE